MAVSKTKRPVDHRIAKEPDCSIRYHLYFDDTGSRDPDRSAHGEAVQRSDGMDCFGLGGLLVKEADISDIIRAYRAFCEDHRISYPLHSWAIRGGRQNFGWLKKPEKAGIFLSALEELIISLPIVVIGCIVHRPGYVARYREIYGERLWYMCKTAFAILIERAAKFVEEQNGRLEVYFEESGRKEDRDIVKYMRELKTLGLPFDTTTSGGYAPFAAKDFRRIIFGKPQRKTKRSPMIQLADLVLYPLAKSGYDPSYRPYVRLKEAGKLIDCYMPEGKIRARGIKYSCFDG